MGLPKGKTIKSSSLDDRSSTDFERSQSTNGKHETDTLREEIAILRANLSALLQDNYRLNKTNAELQTKCNVSNYSHKLNSIEDISSQSTSILETGIKRNLITQ